MICIWMRITDTIIVFRSMVHVDAKKNGYFGKY